MYHYNAVRTSTWLCVTYHSTAKLVLFLCSECILWISLRLSMENHALPRGVLQTPSLILAYGLGGMVLLPLNHKGKRKSKEQLGLMSWNRCRY